MIKTAKTLALAMMAAIVAVLSLPVVAQADGDDTVTRTVCTTAYGGEIDCQEEEVVTPNEYEEIEELVDTGLVENLMVAGSLFVEPDESISALVHNVTDWNKAWN